MTASWGGRAGEALRTARGRSGTSGGAGNPRICRATRPDTGRTEQTPHVPQPPSLWIEQRCRQHRVSWRPVQDGGEGAARSCPGEQEVGKAAYAFVSDRL